MRNKIQTQRSASAATMKQINGGIPVVHEIHKLTLERPIAISLMPLVLERVAVITPEGDV
jgi:hypothetical protein